MGWKGFLWIYKHLLSTNSYRPLMFLLQWGVITNIYTSARRKTFANVGVVTNIYTSKSTLANVGVVTNIFTSAGWKCFISLKGCRTKVWKSPQPFTVCNLILPFLSPVLSFKKLQINQGNGRNRHNKEGCKTQNIGSQSIYVFAHYFGIVGNV